MANVPAPPQPEKKGLSPLAWIAIGCLGILVLGGIAASLVGLFVVRKVGEFAEQVEEDPVAATARMLAAANPDIELVEADKENRIITFRDTNTGEEITVNYDDIESGKVTFSADGKEAEFELQTTGEEAGQLTVRSEEGTATFRAGADSSDLPAWIPIYPGTTPQGSFASEAGGQRTGTFTFQTDAELETLLDFYEGEKERAGVEVQSRTATPDGALLILGSPDESRGLTVMVSRQNGLSEVAVTFMQKP